MPNRLPPLHLATDSAVLWCVPLAAAGDATTEGVALGLIESTNALGAIEQLSVLAAAQDEKRRELLQQVRAGEQVDLLMRARVYYQREGNRNRNSVRFRPGMLRKFARSFRGMPFLRDHQQGNSLAVGGRILRSELTDAADGGKWIEQDVRLSAPWAVEHALLGLGTQFSIGWNPTGSIHCSICKADWRDCNHWPGRSYEVDGADAPVVAEAIFQEAEGIETSFVPVPAVPEVGIEDVRQASLSTALALYRSTPTALQGDPPMSQQLLAAIAKALGLPQDAELESIVAKAAGMLGQVANLTAELELEKSAHGQTKTALAKAQQEVAAGRAERLVALGVEQGRIVPAFDEKGDRVETPVEAALVGMVEKLGYEAARDYVEKLPKITAAGAPRQAPARAAERQSSPAGAPSPGGQQVLTHPAMVSMKRQLRLTDEQIVAQHPELAQ